MGSSNDMIPPMWALEKVKALEVFFMDKRIKFTKEEKISIVKRYNSTF